MYALLSSFSKVFCPEDGFSQSIFAFYKNDRFFIEIPGFKARVPEWLLNLSPLPNISTSSSPENAIPGPQKPSPGKCQKIPRIEASYYNRNAA